MTPSLKASPPAYVPRDPSQTILYHVVADHLETFLASLDTDPDATGLPTYVHRVARVRQRQREHAAVGRLLACKTLLPVEEAPEPPCQSTGSGSPSL